MIQPTLFDKGHKHQSLADRVRASKDPGTDQTPHLIVKAGAGTGKTTTLIEGVKRVLGQKSSITPTVQQYAIWKAMMESQGRAQSFAFCAFGNAIAETLSKRVPPGCEASTMHSLGLRTVRRNFELRGSNAVDNHRVDEILAVMLDVQPKRLRYDHADILYPVKDVVKLCKQNLVDGTDMDKLDELCRHYDVDLGDNEERVYRMVPQILERCKDVAKDGYIDFDDMIWLPITLKLMLPKYDMLLVDEAQDLNMMQQAMVMQVGRRIVLCGDENQAIFGFAGADADSMPRMERLLSETPRGCVVLPLTLTRRCGRAIVREANKYVPELEAFESNGEGAVSHASFDQRTEPYWKPRVEDGDMVLCRINAPLVSQCFSFLSEGRKAYIQGRDVAEGLLKLVSKLAKRKMVMPKGQFVLNWEVEEFVDRLETWKKKEERKENAKRYPSTQKLLSIQDRYECLMTFALKADTIQQLKDRINSIFSDERLEGIRFSSVHKAKGLEANRVFLLLVKGAQMPHPMAKTQWAEAQEYNLLYVAITRAIKELVYVTGGADEPRKVQGKTKPKNILRELWEQSQRERAANKPTLDNLFEGDEA